MIRRVVVAVLLLALAAVATVVVVRTRPAGPTRVATAPKQKYQCSMHPQIVSDEPGICPICQMQLTPVEEAPAAPARERRIVGYRHPMRPDVTSPVPARDEMGMDYLPIFEESPAPAGGGTVPGHAPFTLSAERQQLIGVTRARIDVRPLVVEIRTVGRVAYDPKLYEAIVEYREALRARERIQDSPFREAHEGSAAIVRSAALKLRQRGFSEAQIAAIDRHGPDPVNLLLPGPSVWVYAQVYEYELDLVRPQQELVVTAPSVPGRTWTASVAAIDPVLDPATRTARVRALVSTPEADLRPESFVDVRIRVPLGDRLAVPEDAVLDTGAQRIVFVVVGEGRFEPRAVTLGRDAQGYYEVLDGLHPGEEVVTSANFLIDSESRFRAALTAFGAGGSHEHAR
jgi:hypothetical protein